jgi:small subunit ribosomal protein S21
MLIVKMKDGENIERALKRLKRKFNDTKVVPQLREREKFTKPSVIKREQKKKAIYIQKLRAAEENS